MISDLIAILLYPSNIYSGAKNKPYLNTQQLVKFFNDEQRDPRLNEILFPFADPKKAKELVDQFEPNKAFAKKGQYTS